MISQDGTSTDRRVNRRGSSARLFFLAICLGSLAVVGVFLYPSLNDWLSADRSIDFSRLRTGVAGRGDLLRDVSVQGRIVAADHPTIVSPAQGVITVLARAGNVVSRGQTLARIESPELANQLEQEKSVLDSMGSELERRKLVSQQSESQNQQRIALLELRLGAGERAVERALSLLEEGLGSSIDYERARDEAEITRLELNQAVEDARMAQEASEFEIRSASIDLERQRLIISDLERRMNELRVESPVSGLVSRVEIKDKDTVQPAQALFAVVDLSEFQVEVLIPENYADEVILGTQAMIRYEEQEYPGEVESLSPEVDASQVKGMVNFIAAPPSGLKQNQRVFTRIILDSRRDVLKIPRGPFLEATGGRQAYVVEGQLARLRPIRIGAVSVTEVEVVEGLEEGEEVILTDLSRFDGVETILLRR